MATSPYKLRLRRVRDDVLVDLLVPVGRAGFTAVESVNMGPVSLKAAIAGLQTKDLNKAPRLKDLLFPPITVNEA